ncbi:MAG: DHH family phosphoesterase [Candidatus Andersenbacteria bacterium]
MALAETQQAIHVLQKATSVLLLVPEKPTTDAFSSMVALYLALLESHKGTIDAVSSSHVPAHLQFLPGSSQVQTQPNITPEIVLDIAGPELIADTRTETLTGGLRLHLTLPAGSVLNKDDIEVHVRQMAYDAVVICGASDLETLGDLFTNHADFFYNIPVINIDHRADNEHFGMVNLIDITRSSIAEIVYELVTEMPEVTIGGNIATALYAGIVGATESFQKPSTNPHAFEIAAKLMEQEADKETVIQNLVKTKPLYLLKLTGRLYARLRHDEHGKLFWSLLRSTDFQESGATPEHIPEAMHELTNNISGYNVAFLLHETDPGAYRVYVLVGKGLIKRKREIQEQLEAQKENGALTFTLQAASLNEAEQITLGRVRSILP